MTALTDRQKECLDYIIEFQEKRGYSPSIRQIADEMGGIGTNAVFGHLMALESKGYIEREAGLARAIRILARA
jgi:repressor LexA